MQLINNYISRSIFYPTISIIVILSSIILLTQSLKYIDLMVTHGISSLDYLYLTLLLLPSLLFAIIPICLFIAILYSLNKLSGHRELNILKGVGISDFSIAKPMLKIGLIIALFHYFIALYLMPEVNHKFKDLSSRLKESYITFFVQEKVFTHPTKDLTFFIKNKVSKNKFEHIFLQDRNNGNPITVTAKSGQLMQKDGKIFLHLVEGKRQEISRDGEMTTLNFDTLLWQLNSNINSANARSIGVQEQHLYTLLFNDLPEDSSEKKKMFVEANQRIILPFYNIILMLLAISAVLQGQYNRLGKTKRIIAYSIAAGAIIIINTSLINLSANYKYVIICSYLFTFTIFGSLIYKLRYRSV